VCAVSSAQHTVTLSVNQRQRPSQTQNHNYENVETQAYNYNTGERANNTRQLGYSQGGLLGIVRAKRALSLKRAPQEEAAS